MLADLLQEIRSCVVCEEHLPLGCRPVLSAHTKSKILIIGQAPGVRVHNTGVPWNDPSGVNLRKWLGEIMIHFIILNTLVLYQWGSATQEQERVAISRPARNVLHYGMNNCTMSYQIFN